MKNIPVKVFFVLLVAYIIFGISYIIYNSVGDHIEEKPYISQFEDATKISRPTDEKILFQLEQINKRLAVMNRDPWFCASHGMYIDPEKKNTGFRLLRTDKEGFLLMKGVPVDPISNKGSQKQ